ncbi:hypothetical protein APHAL10511_000695 [Amanita phalloides]|nr:hypothetical protein APHAL10511_000695 [Amanita phalloides]
MPPGTPFNAFALPYRIRVDDFTQLPPQELHPLLYLLTHTHTDHVNGLASKSFGSTICCSRDAKEMLLRHEAYAERELYQLQLKAEKRRTYSHLKTDAVIHSDGLQSFPGSRDLLKPLPLNTPTTIELQNGEEVSLTLIDANHCPGAIMYLIEGAKGNVLHTGDFRAEPWFLDNITRNPFLQPYLAPLSSHSKSFVNRTLDAIYLDTACVFSTLLIPTKEQATTGLVELIKLHPPDTHFFINSWTWGYEDILKSIARAFQCQIHVDRYKYSIYQRVSDPYLRSIVTMDPEMTRFHACERFHRCEHVASDDPKSVHTPVISRKGKHVVYVNPVTMDTQSWELYLKDAKQSIRTGETMNTILVPLSRHSTLPELQAFVRLFRPRSVVPNTLDPRLRGLDWQCIDHMFSNILSPLGRPSVIPPTPKDGGDLDLLLVQVDEEGDTALKNIVGPSALALRWADRAKLRDKLEIMVGYLDPKRKSFLDKLLKLRPDSPPPDLYTPNISLADPPQDRHVTYARDPDSDSDSDKSGAEDDHWRTAHMLFCSPDSEEGQQLKWVFSSPKSQEDGRDKATAHLTPPVSHDRQATNDLPLQGLMPHLGSEHSGCAGDHPSRTTHVLGPPIQLPTSTLKSAHRDASKKPLLAEYGRRGHTGRAAPRDSRTCTPLSESTKHQIMTSVPQTRPQPDIPEPSSSSSMYSVRDENVFVRDPRSKGFPVRSAVSSGASVDKALRVHQGPRRSPRGAVSPEGEAATSTSSAIAKRKRRVERTRKSLELADRLARANPARVASSYRERRARLLSECVRSEVKNEYLEGMERAKLKVVTVASVESASDRSMMTQFETVDGSQMEVDWERSRALAEKVGAELASGRWPVFPRLACTENNWPGHAP